VLLWASMFSSVKWGISIRILSSKSENSK
jgi:hypothetical protein